ncbi:hypothetical protein SMI01S_13860 [Sphingobacterium mizutaii NBRC 14946 = DSM 11724]|uniref:Uncharacterized protein n=3 Tax=Sphingobacteriaceae TaxID=84566 RepID=A0AAJ4XB48_9SPHI|nr:hypothetical protein SMI01S_13860 [Sphingobacterium mizutaii NBRC 14946 = DSM 11724]SDK99922.1 hypothetical protein SAMN05192578_101769 [Sphingobacterium mizutaii]SNV49836.1 Uncharacterised protein [Sphingobacterium mizutaii]
MATMQAIETDVKVDERVLNFNGPDDDDDDFDDDDEFGLDDIDSIGGYDDFDDEDEDF